MCLRRRYRPRLFGDSQMRARRVIAVCMLALMLGACGSNVFTSKIFGFSAACPEGWTVSEDIISACFGSPAESETDDFFENVTYTGADKLSGTLTEYVQMLSEAIAANSTDYSEVSREEATVAGLNAVILTYTCTSSQTAYVIKQRMFVLSDGINIYNLVYTAHEGSFDTYADEAASIAESFKAK